MLSRLPSLALVGGGGSGGQGEGIAFPADRGVGRLAEAQSALTLRGQLTRAELKEKTWVCRSSPCVGCRAWRSRSLQLTRLTMGLGLEEF